MAETGFSVFSSQCLNRRIADDLKREIVALETGRNQAAAIINWEVLHHRCSAQASAYLSIGFRLTRYWHCQGGTSRAAGRTQRPLHS